MTNTYSIQFTSQLRQHLRALRKKRGLTQAQLGALVGVSQARIAEIEANPGLVSFDQMMQLLSALKIHLLLSDVDSEIDREIASEGEPFSAEHNQRTHVPEGYKEYAQNSKTNADLVVEPIHSINESGVVEQMRKLMENDPSTQVRKLIEKKGSW
ncbi:helix-turn-helix domain-containing protein [Undibacterium flavidum]|uniref:Helix-turn-helix domain-containing protein n=1 Tax=Undibacterium flavidum TaxID=2762297 RepID=A0ABR6Y920_9BURK|nr:helix-turn-helix domain-containing protein [Undibacterium flavidum]MBC3873109.1 helix-turn-helix domain-containing protein [Undibacterium flavidum]